MASEAKSRYVIPEGGALIFRIVKDEGNTRRYEVDKNKPNHITFNVFDKEGLLYLVFADKALTGYALSLNYSSDTMEALDKGDLSKAVLCYTVEKGKPTYEFGRDSIDMLMKVGVAIENLERTVAKGGVLTFDTSDRLATIIAETSLGDMIKEHERYLHLTMTPEKGGIGDR